MPVHDFKEFCTCLCEAVGVAPPALDWTGPQPPALTLDHQGVAIGLTQASLSDASSAVMMVDFGPPPMHSPQEAFRVLLESNFMMMGARAPAFGINPVTGHVVYSQGFRIDDADPDSLARSLGEIAATVIQWRSSQFLLPDQPVRGAPHAPGGRS